MDRLAPFIFFFFFSISIPVKVFFFLFIYLNPFFSISNDVHVFSFSPSLAFHSPQWFPFFVITHGASNLSCVKRMEMRRKTVSNRKRLAEQKGPQKSRRRSFHYSPERRELNRETSISMCAICREQ